MIKIILAASAAIVMLIGLILYKSERNRKKKRMQMAGDVIKYEVLEQALGRQDTVNRRPGMDAKGRRILLYFVIKQKGKKPLEYMLNPEKTITIGRNHADNQINLKDISVSREHCQIKIADGIPYVMDLGSVNKTYVKHGRKKIAAEPGLRIRLRDKDKLLLGKKEIKVKIIKYREVY
ncbi:MAG: FHA domain-containing protein [Lachnospiraceae bacterium]|nr:FHA domain-containing protein [Lachnospiraceae bacterium]